MLTGDDKAFLMHARRQAGSRKELITMIRVYAEEEQGDCLICKQILLMELLEEINNVANKK